MKKILFTLATIFIVSLGSIKAQKMYDVAIGARLGYNVGVTGKAFISEADAIEGILHLNYVNGTGFGLTGLYERHAELFQVPALNFYYGAGGSVTSYTSYNNNAAYIGVAVDGILGTEYTFEDVPINLSLDFKPSLNLVGGTNFSPAFALSVRYVL